MGGWGIDALLGRVTRAHHDLDLILHVADLPTMDDWLRCEGFTRLYEWEEDRPVPTADGARSTAFVEGHRDGREIDVHCIDISSSGSPVLASADPWVLPADTLAGRGVIDGVPIACVSMAAQHAMHVGYQVPSKHKEDLVALEVLGRLTLEDL